MNSIGDRIKYFREQKRLTQEDLARYTGTTKQAIFKYEKGIVTNIPLDKVELLASVLEVSPAFLVGWVSDQPQKERPALFSEDELRLVNAYRQADPTYQAVALELLESHPAQSAKVARA